jgi:serine/threonine-protein kinase
MPAAEPPRERPRRRGLWMALAGTVAGLAALGVIATTLPWGGDPGTGALPTSETAADGAQVQGQEGDGGFWDGDEEDDGGVATSPDPSASATPEGDATPTDGPAAGTAGPSLNPTGSASPSESPSPSAPAKATVPNVVAQSESEARSNLEASGLSPAVEYEGEGEARCSVVRQSPSAGSEVEPGSTVQVTVRRAVDTEACKSESEATPEPWEDEQ